MPVDCIARLHILDDIEPLIWRRTEVPLTMCLKERHDVIQAVMLFEFEAGGRCYDVPDPEDLYERKNIAARNVRIAALIERGIATFSYAYDFGDNWRHTITVEALEDGNPSIEYPRFIDGERREPPKHVGNTSGFEELLNVMAKLHIGIESSCVGMVAALTRRFRR